MAPAGGAGAGGDAWLLGLENRHASAHGLNGSNAQELVAIDVASTTRVQARAPDPPPSSRLLLQIANFRPDVFAIARLCGGQDMLLCATKQCPRQSNARADVWEGAHARGPRGAGCDESGAARRGGRPRAPIRYAGEGVARRQAGADSGGARSARAPPQAPRDAACPISTG